MLDLSEEKWREILSKGFFLVEHSWGDGGALDYVYVMDLIGVVGSWV